MKNEKQWKPSKFILKDNKLTFNPKKVGVGSRLVTKCTAAFYQNYLPEYASGRLVDLGCGNVPLYFFYKKFVNEVVCVDWQNTLHPNPHLDFEMDLNEPLELKSDDFDTVILSDVLEHIRKPEILLSEIYRILKPRGRLLLNVPFFYWLHEKPYDYFRFTEFALREMSKDAGFEIIMIEPTGGAIEILFDILLKNLNSIPRVGKVSCKIVFFFARIILSVNLFKRLNRKSSGSFPIGYFMVVQKGVK